MLLNLVKFSARVFFKTFYDFKVEGLENIPPTGALIIAGNHLSNADPPAIGGFAGTVRDSRFMAKKELFDIPVLGWFFRRCGYISVDRKRVIGDFGALEGAIEALQRGESVVMFPEVSSWSKAAFRRSVCRWLQSCLRAVVRQLGIPNLLRCPDELRRVLRH